MNRSSILLLTLCLLPVLCLLPTSSLAAPEAQREPISVDLEGAKVEDVLRTFEHMAEGRLDLDPQVRGKVTVRLSRVHWTTALDAVCETAGCSWRLIDATPRVLEVRPRSTGRLPEGLDAPVRLRLDAVQAAEAFEAVAETTGRTLSLSGDFSTPLSVTLDGVSAETALTALCEGLGCDWSLTRDDAGLVLRRSPPRPSAGSAAAEISADLRDRLRRSLDLSLAGAPLGAVLQSFGQILEVPIEIEEGVGGSVTIELAGVPFEAALNAVCAAHGCRWRLEREGGSQLRLKIMKSTR